MADILNDMMYLRLSRNRDGTDYTQGFNPGVGYAVGLASHSTGSSTVITTDAPHYLAVGDCVEFSGVTGADAADLNGIRYAVTAVGSTTTFTIAYNSTSKTVVLSAATATTIGRIISGVSLTNPVVITTSTSHTIETGDLVAISGLEEKIGILSATTANPIVFTTDGNHGLFSGQAISFASVTGADAADLNNVNFTVTAVAATNTFSIAYNSTSKTLVFGGSAVVTASTSSRINKTFPATKITATTFSIPVDGSGAVQFTTGTNAEVQIQGISKYVPVYVDGLKAGETIATKEIQTEHRTPGVRYKILTGRNADQASLTTPVHPETIRTVLSAVLQKRSGTYLPYYHTIEQYWNAAITAASANFGGATGGEVYTGRCLKGCVFNGFSINIDRNSPADWSFNASMFIRREDPLATAQPTPTWPAQDPYTTGNVYADIVFLDDDGDPLSYSATYGFSGDNLNLISVSVNYQSNLSVSLMRPSSDVAIDLAWTKLYRTAPSAAINGQLVFNASDYMTLTRMASVRHARLRLMGVGGSPSGETSLTGISITGGASTYTFSIGNTSGFAVGDYILLSQVTANVQNVALITDIDTNLAMTIVPVDPANLKFVAMSGSASDPVYIKNTAWQILVPQFDIQTKEPPSSGGDYKVINFTGTARLVSTLADPTVDNADVITYGAYNDDGA